MNDLLCKILGHKPGPNRPFQHVWCLRCGDIVVESVVGKTFADLWKPCETCGAEFKECQKTPDWCCDECEHPVDLEVV